MGPCPHMHPRRGCINGLGRAPSPYGHPVGVPIIGRDLFSFLLVARPLAFGSLPAPMGTHWVPICAPRRGAHYKSRSFYTRVCECPKGNFGQNYRDLGVNLRAPFWPKLPGSFGPSIPCGDIPSGFSTHSFLGISGLNHGSGQN